MSIAAHRVYASSRVQREAEKLMPGRVVEVEIERAIASGRKRKYPLPGLRVATLAKDERFVLLDGSTAAVVRKGKTPLTGRPAWIVTRLVAIAEAHR